MRLPLPDSMRRWNIAVLLCLCAGCGDEDAATPKPKKDAAQVTTADYSLLLLAPRLATDLKLDAAQRVALALWRPEFQRELRAATRPSGKTSELPATLIERGTGELSEYGERVAGLLAASQKSAFARLRSTGRISGVQIRQADSGQIGVSYEVYEEARKTSRRYRTDDALREIGGLKDALLVLADDEELVQSCGARWLLAHSDAADGHDERLHDLLLPLIETEKPAPRRTFIAAFCLVAGRNDSDLLTRLLEAAGEDGDDVLPALRALIREDPARAEQLIRARLDDLWWHDETLRLFEEMGPDAHPVLVRMSDVLHPNWQSRLQELLQDSGRDVAVSLVTWHRIDWAIEQFSSDSPERRQAAIDWLAVAEPADVHRDTQVTCLLRLLLETTWDEETRPPIVAAFTRWAGPEDMAVLVNLLDSHEDDAEGAGLAADALLRLDPVFVRNLLSPQQGDDRFRAGLQRSYFSIVASRLPQLDSDQAEPTLLLLFEVQEERLRIAVCRALARSGTERSVQVLSASLKNEALTDRLEQEITRTISRIRQR